MSAVDVAVEIAKNLRQTSYWAGEQNYFAESIFDGFSDALLFGLEMVRRGLLGVYGRMFQVVNDWVITEWCWSITLAFIKYRIAVSMKPTGYRT
jgi:hypothetical protein